MSEYDHPEGHNPLGNHSPADFQGPDWQTPTEAAIAAVPPAESPDAVWRAYGPVENLWLHAMTAGGQFHAAGRPKGSQWDFIPPCELQDEGDARAVRWTQQALAGEYESPGALETPSVVFNHRALLPRTLSTDYVARMLGVKPRRIWQWFSDGSIGGLLLPSGALRLAPGTLARLQRGAKPEAA